MQDYREFVSKNGVLLEDKGKCQFCGAQTERGVHECLEIFSLGFKGIDYSNRTYHVFRFLTVDAHSLQHPEIQEKCSDFFT